MIEGVDTLVQVAFAMALLNRTPSLAMRASNGAVSRE